MMMKQWIIAGSVMLGLLVSAPLAMAGGECGCKGKPGKHMAKLMKKAGVSDEVKAKLKELGKAKHTAMHEGQEAMKAKQGELHAALSAATLDQTKIDALAAEMVTLKAAQFKAHVEHMSKVSALLTAEQRAKFFGMMAKHHGKGKKKGGKGCSCGS